MATITEAFEQLFAALPDKSEHWYSTFPNARQLLFDLHTPGRSPRHRLVPRCGERSCVNPFHQSIKPVPGEMTRRYLDLYEIYQDIDTSDHPIAVLKELNEPGLPPVSFADLCDAIRFFGTAEDRIWLLPALQTDQASSEA